VGAVGLHACHPGRAGGRPGRAQRLGGWVNPRWDAELADRRIAQLELDPRQRAGKLSGGQRAQLALTLALAKHLVTDLERVCDYLIVLAAAHVQVTGEVEDLAVDDAVLADHLAGEAIFLAAAAVLAGFCFWWVRRRLA
jgi:hypothetical protein